MQTTMKLLEKALAIEPAPFWHRELKLSRNALHTARQRGHLSPAVAGALAEKIGEDMSKWIVIAALESEKDSACKDHLLKKIRNWLFRNVDKLRRGRTTPWGFGTATTGKRNITQAGTSQRGESRT